MSDRWSPQTRQRWFYGVLMASGLSVVWLLWPFLDVIVYAGVIAAVARPVHERITLRTGGRKHLAAVLTTVAFAVLVIWPLLLLLYQFALEALAMARVGLDLVASGALDAWLQDTATMLVGAMPTGVARYLPSVAEPQAVMEPVRAGLTAALTAATAWLPSLINGVAAGTVDLVLFVFTVITFLAEGDRLKAFVFDISPLESRYEERLVAVFSEFATNMVVGAFVVAGVQGAVATIGYALFGVPRPMFFGVVTAVCAFMPVVGTMLVAVPLSIYMGAVHGWWWGAGLLLYAGGFVASVDNFLRPLIIRGSSKIHPLLIFFALFGGLKAFGLAGVMIGPVLMAGFLALAKLHREDGEALVAGTSPVEAEPENEPTPDPSG